MRYEKQNVLRGVEASGVLLTVYGFGFIFLVVGVSIGIAKLMVESRTKGSLAIGDLWVSFLWWLGLIVLSGFCFAAKRGLQHSHRWATWLATLIGTILFVVGLMIIRLLVIPYPPGSVQGEDSFIFLLAAPCLATGAWLCIYLNLPHVRNYFKKAAVAELPPTA